MTEGNFEIRYLYIDIFLFLSTINFFYLLKLLACLILLHEIFFIVTSSEYFS